MQPSSGQAVYIEVKEMILSNEIPGGEFLSEGNIASKMGTSRTPVREAFRRLEAEGWLRIFPKRGALVLSLSDGEAAQLIEARLLIEANAIAAVSSHPARLKRLVESLQGELEKQAEIVRSEDIRKFGRADAAFHLEIVRAGENQVLYEIYESLSDRQQRMTSAMLTRFPEQAGKIVRDHTELVEFVRSGDSAGYRECAMRHLKDEHGLDVLNGTGD